MIRYKIKKGVYLFIGDNIIAEMKRYYSDGKEKEDGGILLGKVSEDNNNVYITELCQIASSKSDNTHYERDATIAQKIINSRWRKSNGVVNYLGEWHTHPGMKAVPSHIDINSMILISKTIQTVVPYSFLVIMGQNNTVSITVIET